MITNYIIDGKNENNNSIESIDFNLSGKVGEIVGLKDCRRLDWKDFLHSMSHLCKIKLDWSGDVNTIVSSHSIRSSILENIFNQNKISF